ncbi:MAG: hypothetical protein AB7N71_12960 [Phycisphaerae bacterium]
MSKHHESMREILARVQNLLDQNDVQQAIEQVRKHGNGSAEMSNAYAVCLMRSGQADKAVEIYRSALVQPGGVCLKPEMPTEYKANYAGALLLTGNVAGCLAVLRDAHAEGNPVVIKLRAAIQQWLRSLSWWQRLWLRLANEAPKKPVKIDFSLGTLLTEGSLRPAA